MVWCLWLLLGLSHGTVSFSDLGYLNEGVKISINKWPPGSPFEQLANKYSPVPLDYRRPRVYPLATPGVPISDEEAFAQPAIFLYFYEEPWGKLRSEGQELSRRDKQSGAARSDLFASDSRLSELYPADPYAEQLCAADIYAGPMSEGAWSDPKKHYFVSRNIRDLWRRVFPSLTSRPGEIVLSFLRGVEYDSESKDDSIVFKDINDTTRLDLLRAAVEHYTASVEILDKVQSQGVSSQVQAIGLSPEPLFVMLPENTAVNVAALLAFRQHWLGLPHVTRNPTSSEIWNECSTPIQKDQWAACAHPWLPGNIRKVAEEGRIVMSTRKGVEELLKPLLDAENDALNMVDLRGSVPILKEQIEKTRTKEEFLYTETRQFLVRGGFLNGNFGPLEYGHICKRGYKLVHCPCEKWFTHPLTYDSAIDDVLTAMEACADKSETLPTFNFKYPDPILRLSRNLRQRNVFKKNAEGNLATLLRRERHSSTDDIFSGNTSVMQLPFLATNYSLEADNGLGEIEHIVVYDGDLSEMQLRRKRQEYHTEKSLFPPSSVGESMFEKLYFFFKKCEFTRQSLLFSDVLPCKWTHEDLLFYAAANFPNLKTITIVPTSSTVLNWNGLLRTLNKFVDSAFAFEGKMKGQPQLTRKPEEFAGERKRQLSSSDASVTAAKPLILAIKPAKRRDIVRNTLDPSDVLDAFNVAEHVFPQNQHCERDVLSPDCPCDGWIAAETNSQFALTVARVKVSLCSASET